MLSRTRLEINKENLIHNLNYFRSCLNPGTKVMVMVKAFGYGLGNPELSQILEKAGVDYLGVAFVHEGVSLRKSGIRAPIMVMDPHPRLLEEAIKYDLEPEIYSLDILAVLNQLTKRYSNPVRIHLKVETGMNRLGFEKKDIPEMIDMIKNNNRLEVRGVLSHLSSAEIPEEKDFTLKQIREFSEIYEVISKELDIRPLRHILNTAGTINFPDFQFEMIRLGIGVFGVDRSEDRKSPLKPVCSLKSWISQVKRLGKGETVGYSRAGVVGKDNTDIAIVAMGYADGIFRSLGNGRARVWINGQWAPTFGNICMDMFMVDVTGLSVKAGDEVEIFGENQTVDNLAETANTIPYELFTAVGERVERTYV